MNASSQQARVLVVDDDAAICKLLSIKLSGEGFVCRSCESGDEALTLLRQEQFDAVISDLNMPGVTGFEVLDTARQMVPHTAFLMATGVNDLAVGVAAMKRGATDYLLKPFQLEAVVASLHRALEIKRMEVELENYRKRLEQMVDQRTKQLNAALSRIELTYDGTLEALGAALDLRDNETAGHSRRVTSYSLELAAALKLTSREVKELERGAFLHDIGKIGIPDSILLKPGKLTPEEAEIMKTHARIGYDLVSHVAFLAPAAQIVLAHQERFDGTGYPQRLSGEQIPLGARIFSVADTLDAIMSDRPYRRARPFSVARSEIAGESGKQFDPRVVSSFLSIDEAIWERIRKDAGLTPAEITHVPDGNYAAPNEYIAQKASSHTS